MKGTRAVQLSRKKQHSGSDTSGSLKALIGNIAKGFAAELLIGMLLLFLSAFCAFNYSDPDALMTPFALLSLYIAVMSGGAITYKLNKNGKALCGICAACLHLVAMMLIAQLTDAYPYPLFSDGWRIILHLLCIPMGLLGAHLSGRQRKPKRKKRKIE